MFLHKNSHRAVYLPQVAQEQNWNIEETLSNLSVKAELSQNARKKETQFTVLK
ncbi:MAG: AMMECR1 domain-containing protein [Verrucomicrobiota bacterium]|nr:AMMECR1 domain-containing protein [Verrucomicrobiota bacterium]